MMDHLTYEYDTRIYSHITASRTNPFQPSLPFHQPILPSPQETRGNTEADDEISERREEREQEKKSEKKEKKEKREKGRKEEKKDAELRCNESPYGPVRQ